MADTPAKDTMQRRASQASVSQNRRASQNVGAFEKAMASLNVPMASAHQFSKETIELIKRVENTNADLEKRLEFVENENVEKLPFLRRKAIHLPGSALYPNPEVTTKLKKPPGQPMGFASRDISDDPCHRPLLTPDVNKTMPLYFPSEYVWCKHTNEDWNFRHMPWDREKWPEVASDALFNPDDKLLSKFSRSPTPAPLHNKGPRFGKGIDFMGPGKYNPKYAAKSGTMKEQQVNLKVTGREKVNSHMSGSVTTDTSQLDYNPDRYAQDALPKVTNFEDQTTRQSGFNPWAMVLTPELYASLRKEVEIFWNRGDEDKARCKKCEERMRKSQEPKPEKPPSIVEDTRDAATFYKLKSLVEEIENYKGPTMDEMREKLERRKERKGAQSAGANMEGQHPLAAKEALTADALRRKGRSQPLTSPEGNIQQEKTRGFSVISLGGFDPNSIRRPSVNVLGGTLELSRTSSAASMSSVGSASSEGSGRTSQRSAGTISQRPGVTFEESDDLGTPKTVGMTPPGLSGGDIELPPSERTNSNSGLAAYVLRKNSTRRRSSVSANVIGWYKGNKEKKRRVSPEELKRLAEEHDRQKKERQKEYREKFKYKFKVIERKVRAKDSWDEVFRNKKKIIMKDSDTESEDSGEDLPVEQRGHGKGPYGHRRWSFVPLMRNSDSQQQM